MSRKNEFRGKDIETGEWVYGGYYKHLKRTPSPIGDGIKEDDWKNLIIKSGFSDWNMPKPLNCFEVNEQTVGQYIGIKDKHKKKIYEGDIIKICFWSGQVNQYIVKYAEDCAYYMLESVYDELELDTFCGYSTEQLEVIGNIHDNPEF